MSLTVPPALSSSRAGALEKKNKRNWGGKKDGRREKRKGSRSRTGAYGEDTLRRWEITERRAMKNIDRTFVESRVIIENRKDKV